MLLLSAVVATPAEAFDLEATVRWLGCTGLQLQMGCLDEQLVEAVKEGNLSAARRLLEQGVVSLSAANSKGVPVLESATRRGSDGMVRTLLKHGFKPTGRELVYASGHGLADITASLVKGGAPVDARVASEGLTALIAATEGKFPEIVRILLEAGADPDVALKSSMSSTTVEELNKASGGTALHHAAKMGQLDIIQLLVKAGANLNSPDKFASTPLIHAAEAGQLEAVRDLIQAGANIDHPNHGGMTALLDATWYGRLEVVRYLIKHGANPNAHSTDGQGALHYAARKGAIQLVRLLIKSGVDPNTEDQHKSTPMLYAAANGRADAVSVLLEHKADPNRRSRGGVTPLFSAVAAEKTLVVEVLARRGADVNAKTDAGVSPLLLAVENGRIRIAKILLEANADPRVKNKRGETVRYLAKKRGYTSLLRMVMERLEQLQAQKEREQGLRAANGVPIPGGSGKAARPKAKSRQSPSKGGEL